MKHLGDLEFRWFLGRVEDVNDPAKMGRVRVRCFNIHGDEASTPTSTLHWWPVSMPITSASEDQIGRSPTGLQIGSVVWGFFTDGEEAQNALVCGVLVGEDDVSTLARGVNHLRKEQVGSEPPSAFQAQYPHNHVWQTKSGHVIEVDDTPNFERIHVYHRTGTYTEIDQDGRRVNKIVGDDFEIVQRDKTVWIQGNVKVEILGNATIDVSGSTKLTSASVEVTAPTTINGDVKVNGAVTATGDVKAGPISLMTHVHIGVTPGGATTGTPV